MSLLDRLRKKSKAGGIINATNAISKANKKMQATSIYSDKSKQDRPETGTPDNKEKLQLNATARNPNDEYFAKFGKNSSVMREMETYSTIASALDTRKATIEQLSLILNFPEEATDNVISLFNAQMRLLDKRYITGQIHQGIFHGYNVIQMRWDKLPNDSREFITGALGLNFQMYKFNNKGETVYINDTQTPLNEANYFTVVNKPTKYNRYGNALLLSAFKLWDYAENVSKWWVKYCEKFGMPFIYALLDGKVLESMTSEEQDEYVSNIAENIEEIFQSTKGILSDDIDLKVLQQGSSQSNTAFEPFLKHLENNLYKVILYSDGINQAVAGQLGNANVEQKILDTVLQSDRKFVEEQWNRLLLYVGMANQNIPVEQIPTVSLVENDDISKEKLKAETDAILSTQVGLTDTYYLQRYDTLNQDTFNGVKEQPTVAPALLKAPANKTENDSIEIKLDVDDDIVKDKVSKELDNNIRDMVKGTIEANLKNTMLKRVLVATDKEVLENEQQLNEFITQFVENDLGAEIDGLTQQMKSIINGYDSVEAMQNDIESVYNALDASAFEDKINKMLVTADIFGNDALNSEVEDE